MFVACAVWLVVALWLVFLGETVWQHARRSDQPPIYDAATYFQKADNFWRSVAERKHFNPFNLEPTFRPPGTVLMSYPFGFDLDYRGFYLRSILFPAILVCVAVLVATLRRRPDDRSKWFIAVVAVFVSTMPAFYFFEASASLPAPSHWGLVDNFLGGLAALTAAVALRSTWHRSYAWLGGATLLGVVCATVKPTGFIVMAVTGAIWFAIAALRLLRDWSLPMERKPSLRFLVAGSTIYGLAALAILIAALRSEYLSVENLDFGTGAILLMRSEEILTWHAFSGMVRMGVGFPFVLWACAMLGLVIRYRPRRTANIDRDLPYGHGQLLALAAATCAVVAFGFWFWLYGSGGVYQIRYFIPFALIATITSLPVILRALIAAPSSVATGLCVLMLLPILNLAALLVAPRPALRWQAVSGVNVIAGSSAGDRNQAMRFVDQVVAEGHDATVYLASMDTAQASFQAVVDYTRVVKPRRILLSLRVPGDNVRTTTYRFQEMVDSDFWVIAPIAPTIAAGVLARRDVGDIDQERLLIQAWAARLTSADGVEIMSETPDARILRITDRAALETALADLRAKHRWRPVFLAANVSTRLTEEEFGTLMNDVKPTLRDVRFGERVVLRAVDAVRERAETTLRVWWQPLAGMPEQDWVLFVHSIDPSGKMIADQYLPLQFSRPLSMLGGKILAAELKLRSPPEDLDGRLAIGVIRTGVAPLPADHGPCDWSCKRVIVTPR